MNGCGWPNIHLKVQRGLVAGIVGDNNGYRHFADSHDCAGGRRLYHRGGLYSRHRDVVTVIGEETWKNIERCKFASRMNERVQTQRCLGGYRRFADRIFEAERYRVVSIRYMIPNGDFGGRSRLAGIEGEGMPSGRFLRRGQNEDIGIEL